MPKFEEEYRKICWIGVRAWYFSNQGKIGTKGSSSLKPMLGFCLIGFPNHILMTKLNSWMVLLKFLQRRSGIGGFALDLEDPTWINECLLSLRSRTVFISKRIHEQKDRYEICEGLIPFFKNFWNLTMKKAISIYRKIACRSEQVKFGLWIPKQKSFI